VIRVGQKPRLTRSGAISRITAYLQPVLSFGERPEGAPYSIPRCGGYVGAVPDLARSTSQCILWSQKRDRVRSCHPGRRTRIVLFLYCPFRFNPLRELVSQLTSSRLGYFIHGPRSMTRGSSTAANRPYEPKCGSEAPFFASRPMDGPRRTRRW